MGYPIDTSGVSNAQHASSHAVTCGFALGLPPRYGGVSGCLTPKGDTENEANTKGCVKSPVAVTGVERMRRVPKRDRLRRLCPASVSSTGS